MNSRERIRSLFAQLLDGSDADGGADASWGGASDDPFADDPFGAELFSERAFSGDGADRSDAFIGDGFDGLDAFGTASGDGHGTPNGDGHGATPAPDVRVSESMASDWDDLAEADQDFTADPDDSIFADPHHMQDLLVDADEEQSPGAAAGAPVLAAPDLSEADLAPAHEPVCASGFAPTLAALPDRPPTGSHRVAVVSLAEMDRLNEQLQCGWRVIQMLPSGEPSGFVVALRYAGYAA